MPDFVRDKPSFGTNSRRQLVNDAKGNLISLRGQMLTGALKKWQTNYYPGTSYAHYLYYGPLSPEPPELLSSRLFMGSGATAELITSVRHVYARDASLIFTASEELIGLETLTHDADGFLISTNWT